MFFFELKNYVDKNEVKNFKILYFLDGQIFRELPTSKRGSLRSDGWVNLPKIVWRVLVFVKKLE